MDLNQVQDRAPVRQDGRVLRQLRHKRLLTMKQAAALIGCDITWVHRLELEKDGASELMLHKIAAAYGVDPDEIRRQDTAA